MENRRNIMLEKGMKTEKVIETSIETTAEQVDTETVMYEKYKETIDELKKKTLEDAIKYGYHDDTAKIDAEALLAFFLKLKAENADHTYTELLWKKFPTNSINYKDNWVYNDDLDKLSLSNQRMIHDIMISEETRIVFVDSICEEPYGNPALNKLEVLAYLGINPEHLEKIKESVLRFGDMVLIEKLCKDFSITLTDLELKSIAKIASENGSLYDLEKVLNKMPDADVALTQQCTELKEKAKQNFIVNREKMQDGISKKDLFLHFSARKNQTSILNNGILSLEEQRKKFDYMVTGAGADMQKICGRHDAVSVHNAYKGAEGDRDLETFNGMLNRIRELMNEFQREYHEKVFDVEGSDRPYNYGPYVARKYNLYIEDFTQPINVNNQYTEFVNPKDNTDIDKLFVIRKHNESGDYEWRMRSGTPVFSELFFSKMDANKEKLLADIKHIMQDAYKTSSVAKDYDEESLERLKIALDESNYKKNTSVFILDPNLSKSFVMSQYFRESFIDEKVTPDKILGMKLVDEYTQKECYNSGKVGFRVSTDTDIERQPLDGDVILHEGSISITVKNPYKV